MRTEHIFLLEALHPGFEDALGDDEEMVVAGEPVSPRLHITLHQVVASQLLAGNPPETWQTVQRLAPPGYDWHHIMHMIARLGRERSITPRPGNSRSTPVTMPGGSPCGPEAEVQPDNAAGTRERRPIVFDIGWDGIDAPALASADRPALSLKDRRGTRNSGRYVHAC